MQNLDPRQFQDVVDSLQDGLWITDAAHLITYANPAMATIAGIPREQIVGKQVLTGFSEETTGHFRSFYLTALNTGKPTKYGCQVITPGGRTTW